MTIETTPTSVETAQKEKEINFEKIRKQLDQERQEKMKMQERLTELERQTQSKKEVRQEQEEEDDTSEPYVDHKNLNKKLAKWEEKLEQKFEKRAEEKARMMLDQERQQNYVKTNADFQEILTQENIEKFAQKHPAIAERMLRMPDNFDRQALLYEQIKALEVNKKTEDKPSIQQTIEANRKSPFYQPSGVGSSPYAQTGDFSPAGQKNAYEKLKELKSKLRI